MKGGVFFGFYFFLVEENKINNYKETKIKVERKLVFGFNYFQLNFCFFNFMN